MKTAKKYIDYLEKVHVNMPVTQDDTVYELFTLMVLLGTDPLGKMCTTDDLKVKLLQYVELFGKRALMADINQTINQLDGKWVKNQVPVMFTVRATCDDWFEDGQRCVVEDYDLNRPSTMHREIVWFHGAYRDKFKGRHIRYHVIPSTKLPLP